MLAFNMLLLVQRPNKKSSGEEDVEFDIESSLYVDDIFVILTAATKHLLAESLLWAEKWSQLF